MMPSLAVVSGQYGSLIRHEDGDSLAGAGARVLADQVVSAEIFEKGFAGVIDTRRRVTDLRTAHQKRRRQARRRYDDAASMFHLSVVDLHGRQRFPGTLGGSLENISYSVRIQSEKSEPPARHAWIAVARAGSMARTNARRGPNPSCDPDEDRNGRRPGRPFERPEGAEQKSHHQPEGE